MRVLHIAQAIASIVLICSSTVLPRQLAATQVAKLGGWVETMAVRSNGHLLFNRLDVPEIWTLDPSTKNATRLATFPDALGLTGITEIAPDVFVFITGNFNTTSFALGSGSYTVYKLDMTGSIAKAALIKKVPESGFFIGVTPFNNDTVFIADAAKGALYSMTVSTGAYEIVMQDAAMKAPSSAMVNEGIHGLKYVNGYVYFTNTFGNTFNKIKIDTATGKPTGNVTTITSSLNGPEDFTVAANETAYVATLTDGVVYKVTPDGKTEKMATATRCSTCAFGRGMSDKDTLYVATSQGNVLSAVVS